MIYAHRHLHAAILAVCVVAMGCASEAAPGDERVSFSDQALSTVDGGSSTTVPASARPDERQRIRSALDARYTSADVRHTFEALYGDVIDCVDYYAQPAARSLKARGKPVPDPEPQTRSARSLASLPDFMFNGKPDRYGRSRSCPEGTVPILRVTEDEILAAGGLDAYRALNSHKPPPPDAQLSPSVFDHHHTTQLFTGNSNITGTISNISVYAPPEPSAGGFTLGQTWTFAGTKINDGNGSCTVGVDCIQSVEAGWHVYPSKYMTNPNSAHLFTYATNTGYLIGSGCYNTVVVTNNDTCVDFMLQSGAPITPGDTLSASVIGGTQVEIQIYMAHNTSGWCFSFGVVPNLGLVGCWPNNQWSGGMATAATTFEVGAETAAGGDGKWLIPMGSGRPPGAGFGQAAFHRDFAAFVAPDWSYSFEPYVFLDAISYGQSSHTPAGGAWTNWFYFGSEPEIGWVVSPIVTLY